MEKVITSANYRFVGLNDPVRAMGVLLALKPDLIFLDLMMPKQSGTDMYRRLQKDPALVQIPVIVISGLSGRHLAVPEPFAVFDKPIEPSELIDTVERALDTSSA